MKLVVGLGNPGRKYVRTRHNIGFEVIYQLAERFGANKSKNKFQGEITEVNIGGERLLLLCPLTFMNRSGDCVRPARDFYRIQLNKLIIVCDDFHLTLGKIRFRTSGSSGGQKGLGDILRQLTTEEVPRLRVGVGPLPDCWDAADFVLNRFQEEDTETVKEVISRAADSLVDWAQRGIDVCMNEYN